MTAKPRPPKRLRFPLGLSILVVGMTTPLVYQAVATVLTAAAQSVATVVSLVVMWVAVLGVWLCLTGDNTSNIRFRLRLSKADVAVAVLVCLGCLVLVPLLSVLVTQWLGTTQVSDTAQRGPVWLIIVGVATAAVTEEVLYRAAPMELLLDSGASQKFAVAAPLVVFIVCHLGNWNLAHIIGVVVPMGLILSLVYLWRRNLLVNMIVHFVVDAPLIVIAINEQV